MFHKADRSLIIKTGQLDLLTTPISALSAPKMALSLRRQFGIRLKALRLERKLTQEQFAELVGISVDFLSLIERGINAPSFEVLEQMAGKFRLPVRDLFDSRRSAN
ncbi:MAG: helix-turn-helix transcriptional regulator [Bryobacteraceae bacterium]